MKGVGKTHKETQRNLGFFVPVENSIAFYPHLATMYISPTEGFLLKQKECS